MHFVLIAILCTLCLFAGILALMEFGRRVGMGRLARFGEDAVAGVGAVEGAVFALLGLLLAFTFSGAASRFDARRQLIVEEANDIGTAYLRIDLLPAAAQPELRETFRRYVDSRLAVYRKLPDLAAARAELAHNADLQNEIWRTAVAGSGGADASPSARMLLLPAINQMIDITTTRTVAAQSRPPAIVFVMLLILVMASSFLAGHAMAVGKHRGLLHMVCFAVVLSAAVFVILDFDFPRLGFIRIDSFDQLLVDVRAGMK
jgi:hypothetical protein